MNKHNRERKTSQELHELHHCHVGPGEVAVATKEATFRALMGSTGVPETCADHRLENFKLMGQRHEALACFVRSWADGAHEARKGDTGHSLALCGAGDTGKTHLAVGAMCELLASGVRARFFDCGVIMADLRGAWDSRALKIYTDHEAAVFDDLGVSRGSEAQRERLRLILSQRLAMRRITIITTRLAIPSREAEVLLGERLLSRMRWSYAVANVDLPDYRILDR